MPLLSHSLHMALLLSNMLCLQNNGRCVASAPKVNAMPQTIPDFQAGSFPWRPVAMEKIPVTTLDIKIQAKLFHESQKSTKR